MKRGDLYLARKPGSRDPRKQRVFVLVSRRALIEPDFRRSSAPLSTPNTTV